MRPHRTLGNSLGLGAVVLMLGLLGAEIAELEHWAEALTPRFGGQAAIHLGAVLASFAGGTMVQARRATKET